MSERHATAGEWSAAGIAHTLNKRHACAKCGHHIFDHCDGTDGLGCIEPGCGCQLFDRQPPKEGA